MNQARSGFLIRLSKLLIFSTSCKHGTVRWYCMGQAREGFYVSACLRDDILIRTLIRTSGLLSLPFVTLTTGLHDVKIVNYDRRDYFDLYTK